MLHGIIEKLKTFVIDKGSEQFVNFLPNKFIQKIDVGVCTLLCHNRVDLFLVAMSSLFYQLKFQLPIYIVDDGTLTIQDLKKIQKYFTVIYESQQSSTHKLKHLLEGYPLLIKFRFNKNTILLKKKLDPLLLNPFKKFIYLDSDILFFKFPEEIYSFISSPNHPGLYGSRNKKYISIPAEHNYELYYKNLLMKYHNDRINPTFNSGLLCVSSQKEINLDRMEIIIKTLFDTKYAFSWMAEETLLSFGFNLKRMNHLPVFKYVHISLYEEYLRIKKDNPIAIHYSGEKGLKKIMKSDAFHMVKELFLKKYLHL